MVRLPLLAALRTWSLSLCLVGLLLPTLPFSLRAQSAQSEVIRHGAAANREYAVVFAHSEKPCSADYGTAPYVQCMSKELRFVEFHLDTFVMDLRGMAGSAAESPPSTRPTPHGAAIAMASATFPSPASAGGRTEPRCPWMPPPRRPRLHAGAQWHVRSVPVPEVTRLIAPAALRSGRRGESASGIIRRCTPLPGPSASVRWWPPAPRTAGLGWPETLSAV